MDVVVSTDGHWPEDVERILRALPEWFGLEEPILGYIRDASVLPNVVARRTRAFYAALGFLPLEERDDIWGPEDPCLISVKPLAIVETA